LFSVVVIGNGLLAGKFGSAAPTGPTTVILTALPPLLQPVEVFAVTGWSLVPDAGVKVREPMLPAGGSALANPVKASDPPTATPITAGIATKRVNNFFLFMSSLPSIETF
jgi:hypothetical protein